MDAVKLGWALHTSGRMIHINSAIRGKKCECVCPDCGGSLIARQGNVNAWCFSHEVSVNCSGEGALHRAAKQILEECAGQQSLIVLPALNGFVSGLDYRGRLIEEEWSLPSTTAHLEAATQEVSIRADLRTDILATINSKSCAIEICVTNQKTVVEKVKYESEKLTCLEIFLHDLEWNASYDEIKNALLCEASREWLYVHETELLIVSANGRLQKRLSDIEVMDNELILQFANKVVSQGSRLLDLFSWPTISGTYSEKRNTGVSSYTQIAIPKLTFINYHISKMDNLFHTKGVVNNKTTVDVYFISASRHALLPQGQNSALLILVDIGNDFKVTPSKCTLNWINIFKWTARLEDQARDILYKKIHKEESDKINFENFKVNFKSKNTREKLDFIATKLSLTSPTYIDKVATHWNTSWSIWKGLVWYYFIVKQTGNRINIEHIAEWDWFLDLLEWPTDDQSIVYRRKNVWYWFQELASQHVVLPDGGLYFFVSDPLPKNITPWTRFKRIEKS